MAISPFAFNPPTGWNDPTVFPAYEASEAQIRTNYQRLHDQTRNYINNTVITALNRGVMLIETTVSSLPKVISNAAITANHEVLRMELDTPAAQTEDWTLTTANGSLTITGSISGSTAVKLVLAEVTNT